MPFSSHIHKHAINRWNSHVWVAVACLGVVVEAWIGWREVLSRGSSPGLRLEQVT